ncbi:PREDICTED: transcription elongation factor B polypeptide 3-like [Dipodomys ordii]|uniref:Transcription elongation factor B polypeptide 3-like n=1 Tax=Dipodomys ordii TaxID=10020 RepID=A0A1S3GTG1_DIPOR|nr:PREDICTED: transcription elongation factor B polypeptide 3-like [Dipodomys ordii]
MEAAQWECRAVRQIQERLASSTDADELYKSLRLLSVMPISAEILATTGVRETVKGFRKYQQSRASEPLDGGVQACGSRVSVAVARDGMGTQTAEWVWGAVQLLQEHLASSTHSEELRKSLSLLSVLPITAEILGATGVREMVKGFRKHPLVGSMAKELDTRWETLALLGCNPALLSAILQQVSEQDGAQEPRKEALGLSESGWVLEDKLNLSSVVWGSRGKETAAGRGGPNSGPEPPRPGELCEFQGSGKRSASPCPSSRREKRPRVDPESSGGSSRSHRWVVDSPGVSRDSGPTGIRDMPGKACRPFPQSRDPRGLPQEGLPWEPQGQAGARPKDVCRSSEEGKRGSGPLPSKVKPTSGNAEMQAAKLRGSNHQSKSQQQHEFRAPPQSFEDTLNQTQLLPRRQRTKGRIHAAALAQGGLKRNGSSGPRRPSDSVHSSIPRASEIQEIQAGQLAPTSAANPASPVNSSEAVRVPMVQLSNETFIFPGLQAYSGRLPDMKRMPSFSSSRPGASVHWELGKGEGEGKGEGGGVEEGIKGDEREGGRGAEGKGAQGEGEEAMALPFVRKSLKMPLYSGPKRDSLAPWCPQDVRGLRQHSTPATSRPPCILLAPISQTSTLSVHQPQGNTHPRTVAHSGTDRLWQIRCCKAFKDEKPAEGESWRELYLRLRQDQEQRVQAARACPSQEEPKPRAQSS